MKPSIDFLMIQVGDDLLDGGEGKDLLAGNTGDDELQGGAGEDSLSGGAGNDRLTGGAGADAMDGGEGDDTYLFTAGDSPASEAGANETIADTAGNNTVVFETATADDLTLYIGNDAPQEAPLGGGEYLVIDYAGEDRLLVQGGFDGAVATYEFSDGERLSYAELIGRLLEGLWYRSGTGGTAAIGGTGNDQIETLEGGAFLSGGRGNDTLTASGGGNTFLYGTGTLITTASDKLYEDDIGNTHVGISGNDNFWRAVA